MLLTIISMTIQLLTQVIAQHTFPGIAATEAKLVTQVKRPSGLCKPRQISPEVQIVGDIT